MVITLQKTCASAVALNWTIQHLLIMGETASSKAIHTTAAMKKAVYNP